MQIGAVSIYVDAVTHRCQVIGSHTLYFTELSTSEPLVSGRLLLAAMQSIRCLDSMVIEKIKLQFHRGFRKAKADMSWFLAVDLGLF